MSYRLHRPSASLIFLSTLLSVQLWAAWSVLARSPAPPQGPSDLYFLSVGVSKYAADQRAFPNFNAPKYSAEIVARALSKAGGRGILLTSGKDSGRYITRDDILRALIDLKAKIRRDRAEAPRIILYMMMHGLADPTSSYIGMIPGNLRVQPIPLPQQYLFRFAKRAIVNIDLLAASNYFRIGSELSYLDDDIYTDRNFSDLLGLSMPIDMLRMQAEYSRELEEEGGKIVGTPDNRPIPFAIFMDNCTSGFQYNLAQPNPLFTQLVRQQYQATLDVGRIYYAVPAGQLANPLILPTELTDSADKVRSRSPSVGPLAIHIKLLLHDRDGMSMTLREFDQKLQEQGSESGNRNDLRALVSLDEPLRPDVASVEFLPIRPEKLGEYERRTGTGTHIVNCCE